MPPFVHVSCVCVCVCMCMPCMCQCLRVRSYMSEPAYVFVICVYACVCSQCLFTIPTSKESQSRDAHTCTLPSPPSSLAAPLPFQVCERSEEQSCYQRLDIYRMVCMCTCVSVMLTRAHYSNTFATVSGASATRSSGPVNLS